jgi:spore germination protein KA
MEVIVIFKNLNDKKRINIKKQQIKKVNLSKALDENICLFNDILSKNNTIEFRKFGAKIGKSVRCCVAFMGEMASMQIINENILKPLMYANMEDCINRNELLEFIINKLLISGKASKSTNVDELIGSILYGDAVLFVDGINEAIIIEAKGWSSRQISEPLTEAVVRGPREGFTESIKVNMSLIRRKIRDSDLRFEAMNIGIKTKTSISICYIEGTASPKILDELRKRLNNIQIDGILETGYIEELIKDNPLSPFKTIGSTERPDSVVGKLLEGRIAILCDGTPFALTLPYLFLEQFQSSEDYYNSFIYGSFNRLIRIIGFFLSTSIPAMYIALVNFHQEMIPTPLFMSIISAREGVPFPNVVEALIMLFVFEIIREAGIRIPSTIGQAVSIVGALVLGDAAVNAKVISAPIVIVIAISGISSFLIPKMISGLVLMRILLLALSSVLGIYGYMFGIILIFIHLMSIESFGVPYMTNVNSINKHELQDCAVRAPWWYMNYRSIFVADKPNEASQKEADK